MLTRYSTKHSIGPPGKKVKSLQLPDNVLVETFISKGHSDYCDIIIGDYHLWVQDDIHASGRSDKKLDYQPYPVGTILTLTQE